MRGAVEPTPAGLSPFAIDNPTIRAMPSITPTRSDSTSRSNSPPPAEETAATPASPARAAPADEGLPSAMPALAQTAAHGLPAAPRRIGNLPADAVQEHLVPFLPPSDRAAFSQTSKLHRQDTIAHGSNVVRTSRRLQEEIGRLVEEGRRGGEPPPVEQITARLQQAIDGAHAVHLDFTPLAEANDHAAEHVQANRREWMTRCCDAASRISVSSGHPMEQLRLDVADLQQLIRVDGLLARLGHVHELDIGFLRGPAEGPPHVPHALTEQLHRLAPEDLTLRFSLQPTADLLRPSANRYGPSIDGPDMASHVKRLGVSSEWLREPRDDFAPPADMFHQYLPHHLPPGGDSSPSLQAQHLQRVNDLFASLERATRIHVEPSHDTRQRFDPGALAYTAAAALHAPALRQLELPALEAPPAQRDAALTGAIDRLSEHPTLLRVSIGNTTFERASADQRLQPPSDGGAGPA
jgi:hypothetical protein